MNDISYQSKDVASKVTGEALVGRSLAPFNRPDLKIIGLLPTNLPAIESKELRLDNLFLLSDGSVAIMDYESAYDEENFVKYLNYVARVVKRYAKSKQLKDLKELRVIVIYTADVEQGKEVFDLGCFTLRIDAAYLVNQNSNHIYQKLRCKIEQHEPLTEEEMTELMLLPLTAKGKKKKQYYMEKAVDLAKKLPRQSDTFTTLSGLLTFTDKLIDKDYAQRLKEECFMLTQVERLIYEDCWERAMKKAMEEAQKEVQEKIEREKETIQKEFEKEKEAIRKELDKEKEVARKELDKEKEVARKQVQKQVRKQSLDNTALYLAKTSQDLNFTKEYALQHLTEVTGATRQEALKYLNKYWRS